MHKPFIVMPNKEGRLMRYCIARWNEQKKQYIPLKGQEYSTKEEAETLAKEYYEVWKVKPEQDSTKDSQ